MKLSKEELSAKVNDLGIDDELKISLMEDIADSIEPKDTTELDELKSKYEEIKTKYKERFLKGGETEEKKEESKNDDTEELKEQEIIDVKEI